ncbi:ABC transporter permease [Desulfosporosinus meridiei]|uniref:ABC-type dipeptide/oligopeptide/nickel transport system, permease component n=1 Tax=Desulfosporosinus meridiei (strain ATCC BAA-275 / DSM 13257 / KCTC 12902 / NCIMB 13706 / S10) TaxID=768704 RepID=J7ILA5_DESMD|nr:ABC transporter permease [Desulfosporosinus meridiei]AFQ42582.1 ABC-type dipeptide/oligopeptide/nickel transport system, permease component [Desulfosporosinus meridiei DSM 13257]
MKKFELIIKRVLQVIPMLLIVSILAFALSNLSSGDVAEITIRSEGLEVTEQNLAAVREELGLNAALPVQYLNWLTKAARFDFGVSFQTKKSVSEEIISRFPATLKLAITAMSISVLLAIPIALISARYKDSIIDHFFRILSTVGVTMPDFWLGLMLLYIFAVQLKMVPVISGSKWQNIFLPAFTLSVSHIAVYTRILRNNLLEINNLDYMRAARARGLSQNAALLRHGLKNAVLPCITLIGVDFGHLLAGQFACETIFSWNGIGKFAIDSIKLKDLPVIQGYIMIVAVTFIVVNLFLDILYLYIDPKIQLK